MITAGIDCGTRTVKVAILKDGKVVGKSMVPAGIGAKVSVKEAYDEALKEAGIKRSDVQKVVATGAGRRDVDFANGEITEVSADSKGIKFVMPSARTVVDVGAEEGKAIRVNADGTVADFAINEKCAAGAGTFVEAIARAIETKVENMAELYFQSAKEVPMNAQCAVFAESELVSLIHAQTAKPDIVRAVINAIADRVVSMMRRVGVENDVAAIGGVALNKGFIDAVEKEMGVPITVPADPQFVAAFGAAISAVE
jgi:benzoyl-CoA reductase subunit D